MLTAASVGAALGSLGSVVAGSVPEHTRVALSVCAILAALALELAAPKRWLPQLRRQTRPRWFNNRWPTLTGFIWGADIGLTFSTWLGYFGVWALAGLAVLAAEPLLGASMFAAFWIGRASSVWTAGLLSALSTTALLDGLQTSAVARRMHLAALLLIATALAISLQLGQSVY